MVLDRCRMTHCVFVDGHSEKVNSMDMTAWGWGLPRAHDAITSPAYSVAHHSECSHTNVF
jgi:hypothetical protein